MRTAMLWLGKAALGGGLVLAQAPPPPPPPQQQPGELRLVSDVRLVVLDVGVRDAAGRPVAGLARGNFRVFDEGRPRPIAAFAAEDSPVTIGLVLDTSGSMRGHRAKTVAAASALVAESRADDEMFLVTFNDTVAASPPAAPGTLRRRIEETAAEGRTSLYDGIGAALDQLSRGAHERKALVIISDGADTASRLTREEVLGQVQRRHATIYAIGITGNGPESAPNPGFLRKIAQMSGGDLDLDVSPEDLPAVCRRIARQIRSRYMVAFHAAETRKTETRRVRVEVSAADGTRLRVLARRNYVSEPTRGAQP